MTTLGSPSLRVGNTSTRARAMARANASWETGPAKLTRDSRPLAPDLALKSSGVIAVFGPPDDAQPRLRQVVGDPGEGADQLADALARIKTPA